MVMGSEDQKALLTDADDAELEKALHKLIKKVGEDLLAMKFNTPIAAMMEFVNLAYKAGKIGRSQAKRFMLVLAPFAPHVAEELWQFLGATKSLAHEPWPSFDEAMTRQDTIELPVQVNGKLRARITVPAKATEDEVIKTALADEHVIASIAGKTVVKQIVIPGRMVNLVVK